MQGDINVITAKPEDVKLIRRLSKIKHTIIVMSGKGGVGKSTVSINLAVGLCTPPVGSALYVGCAVGKTTLEATSKAMLPMYAAMVVVLMFVTFIPAISLWLPGLL
jgi:predicted ATPase